MNTSIATLVASRWFRGTVIAAILLGGLLAGLETNPVLRTQYANALQVADAAILVVFLLELAMKLLAHGRQPWHYFRDGWNVFDFTIIVLCCLPVAGPFAAVLRLARVLRLLRLVSAIPQLQLLVGALLKSLGAMGYLGLLLGLIFYVYGVMGVHLFGQNDPLHFGNLGSALLTLFKIITLENWSTIFDQQYHGATTESGAPIAASLFFITFILFGTMLILNLFIGIVMNSMSEMHAEIAAQTAEQSPEADGPRSADRLGKLERKLQEAQQMLSEIRKARETT